MMDPRRDPADELDRFFSEKKPQGIVSAYLFGSHHSGYAHRESDVDVAILLDWESHPTRSENGHQVRGEPVRALDMDRVVEALNQLDPVEGFIRVVAAIEAAEQA